MTTLSTFRAAMSARRRRRAGRSHGGARDAAVVVKGLDDHPALVLLASDVSLAGLALSVEGIEVLLQTLLGGLAGVDGTAQLALDTACIAVGAPYSWPVSTACSAKAFGARLSPKKRGPDQWAPVISRAILVSDR